MFYRVENIPSEQSMQTVVAQLLPFVPLQRREKALQYKHLHGQYCCLRAWKLLHELLIEHKFIPASFPLSELTYTEDEYGKPSLNSQLLSTLSSSKLSTIEFSISHTKDAIAVAIAHEPVGIDVETIVPLRRVEDRALIARTMCAAEQEHIASAANPCLAFTQLWTQKEALFKALGTGINFDTLSDVLAAPHPFRILTAHTASYALSVAYR